MTTRKFLFLFINGKIIYTTSVLGGYEADSPTIGSFWRVVEEFTEKERRQLLKFVTSCSRPPLLGFKVS